MKAEETALQRVNEYYRRAIEGHVYIQSTFDTLWDVLAAQFARLGSRPRVLELGCHAGFVTESLLQRWPNLDIVVYDDDEDLLALARARLSERSVRYHGEALEKLEERFDLVISVAKHHHLPHGYLHALRHVVKPDAVYALADELCPEYCGSDETARISSASGLRIAGGFVFTSEDDWEAYEKLGVVPRYAAELEILRQRALWRWYRFVVDHAVERGYFDIAAGELQSARDDLVTGSAAEHKFSATIVEREFALAGFRLISKRLIGPADDPERQSMFVYEFGTA